jgi:cytochrome P450
MPDADKESVVTDTELLFNPFVPGFDADPYPHYQRMRDQDPVHEHPLGFWLVSRYDDVTALLRAKLSVESRNLADGPIAEQFQQLDQGSARALSMLDRDPPDHTRLRALVMKVFTVKAIAALEPMVTELVDRSLDRIADGGEVDLIDELAFPLPFAVISTRGADRSRRPGGDHRGRDRADRDDARHHRLEARQPGRRPADRVDRRRARR